MATPILVDQETTLVQVDTTLIPGVTLEHIVILPSVDKPGNLVTIRDIAGFASLTNPIIVRTAPNVTFLGTNEITYKITQPYGFITVTPRTSSVWAVLNTFGFPGESTAANLQNITTKNLTATQSYLDNAIISTALISTLSTDNVFIRNNLSVGQSTIAHAGFYVCSLRTLEDMLVGGTLYAGSTVSSMFANITSTLTVPYISTQNIEIYGVLRSASTISTMGPLFVGSSISTTGNLAVGGSTFIQGELQVLQNVIFQSSLSTLYNLGVGREAMFYSSVTVKDNILTNGSLSTISNVNVGGSLSVMKSAFFTGHVSTQSNLTVGGALSVMSTFYTYGDAVLNSSLYVRSGISTLSNVYIASSLSVGGALAVYGDIFFNDRVLDLRNLSVTQDLFVNNNISTYSSITAGQDLRVMGSTFLMGPISTLSNMTIGGGLSTMKELAVTGAGYFQSNVVIQSTLSTVGNMNVAGFISTLSSVAIGHNLRVQSNLFVGSSLSTVGSAVFFSSMQIQGGLSVFSSVAVACNLDVAGKLIAGSLSLNGSTIISTLAVTNTFGFGLNLSTSTLHYGLFSTFGAMNIGGAVSTMNTLAVGSTIDTQFITVRQNLSTLGNAGIGNSLFALSNIQSGASTIVNGGFYTRSQAFFADSVRMKNLIVDTTADINGVTTIQNSATIARTLTVRGGVNINNESGQQGQNIIMNDTYMSSIKTSSIINYNFMSTIGQAAFFSSMQIQGSLSVFSSVAVSCNADVGGLLTASSIAIRGLQVSTMSIVQQSNFVLNISSSTLHYGLFSTSGAIFSGRLISTTSSLAVGDNVNFYRNLTVGGNTVTNGIFQVGGAATLSNILQVAQATTLSNTLAVGSATTLSNTLAVGSATTLSNTLGVAQATTLSNTLAVGGATTLSNTLAVGQATTLSNTLNVAQAATMVTTLNVGSVTTLSNTLLVGQATTLSNTLNVGQAARLSNTLNVGSVTTLSNTLLVGQATTLSNTLAVAAATTLSNTLAVGSATTLSNTLGVAQATTLSNTLAVGSATTLSNTLNVIGATTLPGGVTVTGSIKTAGTDAVAFGNSAGAIQGSGAIAIGKSAGANQQGTSIAIGQNAGATQLLGAIAIGHIAGSVGNQGDSAVAIGYQSGQTSQQIRAIAIGREAGRDSQGAESVAIGFQAGMMGGQNSSAVAIGNMAGQSNQLTNSVAIGNTAGRIGQQSYATAIGAGAGTTSQSGGAVAVGVSAGNNTQGANAVAIGNNAGQNNQGSNAIAIGFSAGQTSQASNSIILNASGSALNTTTSGLFINPINPKAASSYLKYNTATSEISYVADSNLTVGTLSRFIVAGTTSASMLTTSNYGTTYTSGTQSNLTSLTAMKTNAKTIVAVGSAASGLPIMYSSDGINWARGIGNTLTSANDLIWTGTQFVAVGNAFVTSPDGITWATVTLPTSTLSVASAVAFNGYYYMIASSTNPSKLYKYEPNALPAATITEIATGFTVIHKIFWTGSVWLIGGDGVYKLVSYNGSTLTQLTYPTDVVKSIASDGKTIVAVGGATVSYSADGVVWSNGSNPFAPGTSINDILWDGVNFVAFFNGGNKLARSVNGINWTLAITSTSDLHRGVAFRYSGIQTLANNGLLATDSISTTGFVTIGDSLRVGQSTLVVQDSTRSMGVNCNSPSYPVDVNGILNARFIYQNGAPYQPPPTTGAVTIINLTVSTLTAGTSASIINTNVPTRIVIVGQTNPITSSRLYTGTTPSNMTLNNSVLTGSPVALNATYYTGTSWFMGGQGPSSALLYSSPDSAAWSLITPTGSFPNTSVNAIVYNGLYYLVCGKDTSVTNSTAASRSIVKSTDMNTFSASSVITGNLAFTGEATAAAWNGTLWVAVGQDTKNGAYNGTSIKYSYDGTNWLPTVNAFGATGGLTASIGYTVVWNGTVFVAGGADTLCTLKYSSDGITWINCKGTFGLTNLTKVVVWSGKRFVAVQTVFGAGSNIFYSDDGITWSTASQSISYGSSLVWTGSQFILGTSKSATNATMYVSADGVNWTIQAPATAYDTALIMNSIGYSSNTVPDLRLANTNFFSKQPQLLGNSSNTNTIQSMSNAFLINNLYSETSGKVGINNNNPKVALDVNGSINFTGVINSNGTPLVFTSPGVNSAGNVGINAASNSSNALYVNGSQSNTGILYLGSSLQLTTGKIVTSDRISIGCNAGVTGQSNYCTAIGFNAGNSNQRNSAIAIGFSAGMNNQSGAVALGFNAGSSNQGQFSIAIGNSCGQCNQSPNCIAIGRFAGQTNQPEHSIVFNASGSVLNPATTGFFVQPVRSNAGTYSLTYDTTSGEISYSATGGSTAGVNSVGNVGINSVANGSYALYVDGSQSNSGALYLGGSLQITTGKIVTSEKISVGFNAGQTNQDPYTVAIGYQAATTGQKQHGISIGTFAGQNNQGEYAVAIGRVSGLTAQGFYAISIGANAGQTNQAQAAVAVGTSAGAVNQGGSAVAIGNYAGYDNQGVNSIAIGSLAGQNFQPANSIALNASGSVLNATTTGFFVNPVRQTITSVNAGTNILCYTPGTSEISYFPTITLQNNASIVTTYAGSGVEGNTNGTGTDATFRLENAIASDTQGRIYVYERSSNDNRHIRRIQNGVVTTIFTTTFRNFIFSMSVSKDGTIYYGKNDKIAKITTNDGGTTFNSSVDLNFVGTQGIKAMVQSIKNPNILYFVEGDAIFLYNGTSFTLIAGDTSSGYTDSTTGTNARFFFLQGICLDSTGDNLYLADTGNNSIRKMSLVAPYAVTTYAGNGSGGYVDGPRLTSKFNSPYGIAIDSNNNIYVADTGNNRVRFIDALTGIVYTAAGNVTSGSIDGTGESARFNSVRGITFNTDGYIYVASEDYKIRRLSPFTLNNTIVNGGISATSFYGQFSNGIGNTTGRIVGKYTASAPFDSSQCITANWNPITNAIDSPVYGTCGIILDTYQGGSFISLLTTAANNVVPTERVRITGTGNVGIGTTAPRAALQVNGGQFITGSGTNIAAMGLTNGALLSDTQGAYTTWNQSGGGGETDFINTFIVGRWNWKKIRGWSAQSGNPSITDNTLDDVMSLDSESGLLIAARAPYNVNGGNYYGRTGGLYNYRGNGESSIYQAINWRPMDNGVSNYDNITQGACGIICSAFTGNASIRFYVSNTPGTNAPVNLITLETNSTFDSTRLTFKTNNSVSYITAGSPEALILSHNVVNTNGSWSLGNTAGQGSYMQLTQGAIILQTSGNNGSGGPALATYMYMSLTGVGINTIAPRCPLDVVGTGSISYSTTGFFFTTTNGTTSLRTTASQGAGSINTSIIANGYIYSETGFLASSDKRIKKNIQSVTNSLDVVNTLNIVSFDHIDFFKKPVKHGLIAQEVQKVYPEAVTVIKDYIPSVHVLATKYEKVLPLSTDGEKVLPLSTDGEKYNVIITSPIPHGFVVNDKIKLFINQDGKGDTSDFQCNTDVLEVLSDTEFVVKPWDDFALGKDLLIYGKEVDDFLTIDKPLIGLLAAGACKVLSEKVTSLKAIVDTQAAEIASLKATVAAILEKISI